MTTTASLHMPTFDVSDFAPEFSRTLGPPMTGHLSSDRMAELTKALGHPARIEIVRLLAEGVPLTPGDITATLGLAQSTVSEHLRILRSAGLVSCRRDGARLQCELRRSAFREVARALYDLGTDGLGTA